MVTSANPCRSKWAIFTVPIWDRHWYSIGIVVSIACENKIFVCALVFSSATERIDSIPSINHREIIVDH